MDSVWALRTAYNEARKVKMAQDTYCAKAEAGAWNSLAGEDFPDDPRWEALVDVLRGRVKVRKSQARVFTLVEALEIRYPIIATKRSI